ncbi:MAG: ATP-dependent DNA helicase [Cyanobacteriota bacterium]
MNEAGSAWVEALAASLVEALPRLYQCPAAPGQPEDLAGLLAALSIALAEGQLEIPLTAAEQEAVTASPLAAGEASPLVLVEGRLAWRRWHQQRQAVLMQLLQRAAFAPPEAPAPAAIAALVEAHGNGLDADQQRAVAAVLRHRLVLLEGGPGTGKTSTVARMLAAVRAQRPSCRIQLAAPTGKAAARLRTAIASAHPDLSCSTLHRLLESQGERFRRHRHHLLDLDLLVVDEVSMVDLALMEALLDALPESAQLVLVGDGAQLPPVAPGPVLLELQRPEQRLALAEAAVQLRISYRNAGAIAELAAWLRSQLECAPPAPPDTPAAPALALALKEQLALLKPGANLHWHPSQPQRLPGLLVERLRAHQAQLQQLSEPEQLATAAGAERLLASLEQCLVLSPVRKGPWGVDAVHRALLGEGLERGPRHWPLGTPVLCSVNADELGLANGDLGVLVERQGERRLLFAPAGSGEPLWVHPAQLPAVQPALALTVHKAQGSEAQEVWVLLPESERTCDRLLYTALTRARQQAHLITTPRSSPSAKPARA